MGQGSRGKLNSSENFTYDKAGGRISENENHHAKDQVFPELGRCYAEQRCTDRKFAEADTVQVRELAHIIEHKPHAKVLWWDIAVVSSRSVLDLCNYDIVSKWRT